MCVRDTQTQGTAVRSEPLQCVRIESSPIDASLSYPGLLRAAMLAGAVGVSNLVVNRISRWWNTRNRANKPSIFSDGWQLHCDRWTQPRVNYSTNRSWVETGIRFAMKDSVSALRTRGFSQIAESPLTGRGPCIEFAFGCCSSHAAGSAL